MVETGAGGQAKVDLTAIVGDLIPSADDTSELGSEEKNWAALWVAIALVTSITIGGIVNITTIDSWLFINASTWINESLTVSGNITAYNITADYYFGNGSQLTDISYTETDPLWTANYTLYNSTWSSMTNTSYYLATNPFGFYNSTDFDIADYYLKNNPFGFYNSTDFDIADYFTSAEILGFNYYNSTDFDIADYLLDTTDTFTGNLTFADANNCIIFQSGGKICSGV